MAEMDQITSGSEPPKKRKKHRRLRLKKLNPFRKKKYKKFTEDNYIWDDDLHRPIKKKSKVRRFFSSAARVITFRSLRRKRTTSLPVSLRGRSRYGSTGSLDCLVISDEDESDEVVKGLKRSYSDSELYKKPKDRKKKKLTRKKVKKAGMKAGKLMASGMVQAAGMFQYVTPIPTAIAMGKPSSSHTKTTYYDYNEQRRKHRNYSNMHYAFSS